MTSTAADKSSTALRVLAAIWVVSTVVLLLRYREEALGYSFDSSGTPEHVAAGTTPIALVLGVVGLLFFFVLTGREIRVDNFEIAPLWRRYASLLVDFWSFVFVYGSLSGMIPLMLEARRTGNVQWSFSRDYSVSYDWAAGLLIVVGIAAMVAYFAFPLTSRRQTLGRWMLRIATVNLDGSPVRVPIFAALRATYREVGELLSFSAFWRMLRGTRTNDETRYDENDRLIVVHY